MKKSYLYAAAYAVTFLFFEVDNSANAMEVAENSPIYETVVDRQTFMSAVNSVCDMIDIVKDAVVQADEKLSAQYAQLGVTKADIDETAARQILSNANLACRKLPVIFDYSETRGIISDSKKVYVNGDRNATEQSIPEDIFPLVRAASLVQHVLLTMTGSSLIGRSLPAGEPTEVMLAAVKPAEVSSMKEYFEKSMDYMREASYFKEGVDDFWEYYNARH